MAGGTQQNDEPITAINVTPLVDVCLVLVIIFMAVAPMAVTVGISVLESRAKTAEGKASIDDNVTVKLTADGKLTVNGADVADGALGGAIQQALAKSKDKLVVVTADDSNKVGQVVGILDAARQVGAVKLAVMKTEGGKS
jgi:biopolymer transport protein TolR